MNKTVTVNNKFGIHARPAAKIVELANTFSSDITIFKDDQEVNAKSIMDLMTLGAACGTELKVEVQGDDSENALSAIAALISSDFEVDHV